MIELFSAAKQLLVTLGVMALHGTLLAGLALLAIHGLRVVPGLRGATLRPAWQAAIWLVVLVKFVLPWGPAMPWSLADVIASWRGTPAPVVLSATFQPVALPAAAAPLAPAIGYFLLALVWTAGTAYVLARSIRAHLATLAIANRAPEAPLAARALLASLARRRAPRLVVGDAATGPFVVGLLRPTIVVPPVLVDEHGDPTLLRAALAHELAHVRRRDALGRAVQIVALAIFWWLPVVRLASRALELARERACDAWALESGDVSRPAYARLLVRMAQLRITAAPALASLRTLDTRVDSVLGPPTHARLSIAHKLALVAWIALALGGARSATATVVGETCHYTPELAEAIRQAHPAADLDGDGQLSRDEACDYQAELRKRVTEEPTLAAEFERSGPTSELLAEPLCCNCDEALGPSEPSTINACPITK